MGAGADKNVEKTWRQGRRITASTALSLCQRLQSDLLHFLALTERPRPVPLDPDLIARTHDLVSGTDIDLNAPLEPE